jgi:tRNA(fMet)-specific endonuclease VapC
MKRGLLDTDILSYYLKGTPVVVERVRQYLSEFGSLEFSIVSYYEILRGLERIGAHSKILAFEELANRSVVWTLDRASVKMAAIICADLYQQGTPIGDADVLIAGTALTYGLAVITHNVRHFSRIRGLEIEDWLDGDLRRA